MRVVVVATEEKAINKLYELEPVEYRKDRNSVYKLQVFQGILCIRELYKREEQVIVSKIVESKEFDTIINYEKCTKEEWENMLNDLTEIVAG